MNITIHKATLENLPFLCQLERTCFPDFQQSENRALKRSLTSPLQGVYIAQILQNGNYVDAGSMTLYMYKNTLRLYSVAVLPEFRKMHIGVHLMDFCLKIAKSNNFKKISLEVLSSANSLVSWYESHGFKKTKTIKDYYDEGGDGFRMVLNL